MTTQKDKIVIGLIWLLVLGGSLLVGANSGDPGGAGELAAAVGISLTSVYWYLRRLRTSGRFIRVDEKNIGKATNAWSTAVLVIVLWVVGSVLLIGARVPDGYAVALGWLLPIAVYLVYRFRRSAYRMRPHRKL